MTATPSKLRASSQAMAGRHRRDDSDAVEPRPTHQFAPRVSARLAVIAGVCGALSAIPVSSVLQSILLMVLVVVGAGSAVVCWLELPSGAAVSGTIGLSVSAVIALATLMIGMRLWYPVPSCLALSLIVASAGSLRLWTLREVGGTLEATSTIAAAKASDDNASARLVIRPADVVGRAAPYTAAVLLVSACTIWLLALPLLRGDGGGQYGLLATPGGLLLLIATILAVTGFFVAIAMHRMVTAAVAILIVIAVERVTVTFITEVPIYTWTYKHIGIVDYVIKNGALPSLPFDIYSPWPGFFTGAAWFNSITHLDMVDAAHWFAPVVATLSGVVVGTLALGLGLTLRGAFIAAMVAQVLNWVGQDYFSPQAIAFILAITVLVLLTYSKQYPAAAYMSVPIFTVLVAAHQLTPVWICIAAVALSIFGQIRPRWITALFVAILAIYLIPRRPQINQYGGAFTGFNPFANSETIVNHRGSDGRLFTTLVEQGLALSTWFLAAICLIFFCRGMVKRKAIGIIAFSSMVILFGQNYGGEAIFRVYLYSLPGCAILLAAFLAREPGRKHFGRPSRPVVAAWLVVVAFALAGMQAYYGSWSYITITRSQLEQSRSLLATNRIHTLMTTPAPAGWPTRASADYVRHAIAHPWYDSERDPLWDSLVSGWPTQDTLQQLEYEAESSGYGRVYILLPRQLWAYDEYMQYFKRGALQSLVEQLQIRPGWTKITDDDDTLVYVFQIG
jgi:hypothetical protein